MNLLSRFLRKLNVTSYTDLNEEERKTYRSWEESLNGRKLTDEDVAIFLSTEKEATINKLTTAELKTRDDIFLKMKLEFIRKIENFLNSPAVEKQMAEAGINQFLES
jgi:hypothetical protein